MGLAKKTVGMGEVAVELRGRVVAGVPAGRGSPNNPVS